MGTQEQRGPATNRNKCLSKIKSYHLETDYIFFEVGINKMQPPGDVACPIHLQNKATKPKIENQTTNKNKEEKGKDILTRRRLKHFQHQEEYNCDSRIYWKAKWTLKINLENGMAFL